MALSAVASIDPYTASRAYGVSGGRALAGGGFPGTAPADVANATAPRPADSPTDRITLSAEARQRLADDASGPQEETPAGREANAGSGEARFQPRGNAFADIASDGFTALAERISDFFRRLGGTSNFSGQDLGGADFTGQNLGGARFTNGNVAGASFTGANLTGADFRGADVNGADFTGARLSGADFTGAEGIGPDQLPQGVRGNPYGLPDSATARLNITA
ncbi:pentapeptide repeat-containing protein [Roseospirillum parvum]|uniref:Pentapeptide repeat-containing protein n=1 Tax=Roseospirillum parvum TaxID=83401 RepID=A0A1G8AR76_9PROT|nr:pentapeptide repeat-containing protein [Roseospirillum parvum]SDH23383.1 Pentapeptide repeat-containing protein [Roseospirillum parvum]